MLQEQVSEWEGFVTEIGETWDQYKMKMAQDGVFADELTVRILAEAIDHPMHIVMSSRDGQETGHNIQVINETSTSAPLLLGHYHEQHYQSLGVQSTLQEKPPEAESIPHSIEVPAKDQGKCTKVIRPSLTVQVLPSYFKRG